MGKVIHDDFLEKTEYQERQEKEKYQEVTHMRERKTYERIGIDRTTLCNIKITAVNEALFDMTAELKGVEHNIDYEKRSPVVMENDGRRLSELLLDDEYTGRLQFKLIKDAKTGERKDVCTLAVSVNPNGSHNLLNSTAEQYHERIKAIFEYLEEEYGIVCDISEIEFQTMETNATICLEHEYRTYEKALLMINRNMPIQWYGDGHIVKYATWRAYIESVNIDTLETSIVKNHNREFKTYDKGQHLKDTSSVSLDDDILRIEYKHLRKSAIADDFGSACIWDITQSQVEDVFMKYFIRDVIETYEVWHEKNLEELYEFALKHKTASKRWTSNFLRDCRNYEAVHGTPLLFDLKDMRGIFKRLEPKNGTNASHRYRRFIDQARYEHDMIGHTEHINEIINKVTEMYSERTRKKAS